MKNGDETLELYFELSKTNVGDVDFQTLATELEENDFSLDDGDIKASIKILKNGIDVTKQYHFQFLKGMKLIVKPFELTVSSGDYTWSYDGKEHTYLEAENIEISSKVDLPNDEELKIEFTAAITDVGTYENTFEVVGIIKDDIEYLPTNYAITYKYGTLTISEKKG